MNKILVLAIALFVSGCSNDKTNFSKENFCEYAAYENERNYGLEEFKEFVNDYESVYNTCMEIVEEKLKGKPINE
jgi:hypothetical protein